MEHLESRVFFEEVGQQTAERLYRDKGYSSLAWRPTAEIATVDFVRKAIANDGWSLWIL